MKKQLLAVAMSAGVLTVVGQQVHPQLNSAKAHTGTVNVQDYQSNNVKPSSDLAVRMPFWTEDFSGGSVPAGWTNVDVGTPAGTQDVTFSWTNDPAAVTPSALGFMPSEIFGSTDASNGYLWANSDRGLAASPGTTHITELTTTPIDASAQSSVLLTYEALIGVFDTSANTAAIVRVSNDGGVNWTNFQAFPCLVTGAAAPPCARWSANPQFIEIDISSVAANEPAVLIQFQWRGGWEYFYALDNIELQEVPDYERELLFSVIDHTTGGYEYARIPQSQLPADIGIGLQARNFGTLDQTNVVLTGEISDAGGSAVITSTESMAILPQNDTIFMDNLEPTTPLVPGLYDASFWFSSDQDSLENDPGDDLIEREFEITDGATGVYALDGLGVYSNTSTATLGTGNFVDGADGLIVFTFFRIINNATFTGAEAVITPTSVPGGEVIFSVHNAADVNAGDVFTTLTESANTTVTQQHIDDELIREEFNFPIALVPGDYYLGITMNSFGNANDVSVVDDNTVPQPGDAGLIFIAGGANPGVFGNGNAPALRLSMDPNISVEEVEGLGAFTISPNPSTGLIRIDTPEESQLSVEVRNMLGELVVTERFTRTTTVDLSGYAKGVYTVKLGNGIATSTQLVTLQ